MKTIGVQTEDRKNSTFAQTEFVRTLGSLHNIPGSANSASVSTDSSDEEDETQGSSNKIRGAFGAKARRKRGLSRKKLYIYNIGD
jgi:hypothetical protein